MHAGCPGSTLAARLSLNPSIPARAPSRPNRTGPEQELADLPFEYGHRLPHQEDPLALGTHAHHSAAL